jgi:hypothetical protein
LLSLNNRFKLLLLKFLIRFEILFQVGLPVRTCLDVTKAEYILGHRKMWNVYFGGFGAVRRDRRTDELAEERLTDILIQIHEI